MTKITYTVDIVSRHGGYCIDTAINGQPVSSLGPVDTYEFAKAVQQHQAQAVRWTLESHVKQMQRYMAEQKRGVAA